ncbi:MAG: hypothetical protein E6Q66_03675 [Pedobacter sp.]|jgi:hypothetical protein|nr:MAG: hypothetical protein E6Q66_03675 [Pedobacter sp.]
MEKLNVKEWEFKQELKKLLGQGGSCMPDLNRVINGGDKKAIRAHIVRCWEHLRVIYRLCGEE